MRLFISGLNQQRNILHPVLFAAFAHRHLVDIHTFKEGNVTMGQRSKVA